MGIFRTTVLALFVFVSVASVGQETHTSSETRPITEKNEKKIRVGKRNRLQAKADINQLKDGALLIRLQTKNNAITALRQRGNNELADKIEKEQLDYNLKVVSAFNDHFDFAPFYFFFSEDSRNIKERQFDEVVFLSDNLLPDKSIEFSGSEFLTAGFGNVEQDAEKYYSHNSLEPNESGQLEYVSHYYGGTNMGFGALIMRSDQLTQLRKPFPYYVRTFESLPLKRSLNKTVKKMNKKLHKYHRRRN